jgi:hypothetical protein
LQRKIILLGFTILSAIVVYGKNNDVNNLKTSSPNYQASKKRAIINNNILDNQDLLIEQGKKQKKIAKDIKKILKKQGISKNKIVNISKAKNVTVNQLNKIFYTGNISKNYFGSLRKCSIKCGIAIKGWDNAKEYCSIRNGKLPTKNQIENNPKYNRDICADCTYWTDTEVMRFNKIKKKYVHLNPKEVFVYIPSEKDFFQYETTLTYVATCVSK